jgi:dihydroorotase-like cyclic amidohydrolase
VWRFPTTAGRGHGAPDEARARVRHDVRDSVIDHCEDPSLKADGVAHEGPVAAMLGLKGLAGAAESIIVERDIPLRRWSVVTCTWRT